MKPIQPKLYNALLKCIKDGIGKKIRGKLPSCAHIVYSNYHTGRFLLGETGFEIEARTLPDDSSLDDMGRPSKGPLAKKKKINPFSILLFSEQKKVNTTIAQTILPDYDPRKPSFISKEYFSVSRKIEKYSSGPDDFSYTALHMETTLLVTSAFIPEKENSVLIPVILEILKAGGVPVGWVGDFPDGEIVVYWPHKQDPEFLK